MSPQHRLGEHGWLDAYAAPTVTPGGGSASAVAGALGCALLAMAARIGACAAEPEAAAALDRLAGEADRLQADLVEQERTDAGAYERMVATVRAARATEGDPGPGLAAESARPTPPRSRWPPPSWPPRAFAWPPSWPTWP